MPAHTVPRIAGQLASYGCADLAELDSHLSALYARALTEPKDRKRALWSDLDLLLEHRLTMTTRES